MVLECSFLLLGERVGTSLRASTSCRKWALYSASPAGIMCHQSRCLANRMLVRAQTTDRAVPSAPGVKSQLLAAHQLTHPTSHTPLPSSSPHPHPPTPTPHPGLSVVASCFSHRQLGPRLLRPTQSLCRRSFLLLRALCRAASGLSSCPGENVQTHQDTSASSAKTWG